MKVPRVALPITRMTRFFKRQKRNFWVVSTRWSLTSFFRQLTYQYNSLYISALGADPIQLGSVNSVGGGVGALVSTPMGWLIDRYSLRWVFILGAAILTLVPLICALSNTWVMVVPAIILFAISTKITGLSCSVVCADSLRNEDRATGKALCNTFSSIFAAVSPMVAAFILTYFGGITLEGIRGLYYIRFVGLSFVLLFLVVELMEIGSTKRRGESPNFKQDFLDVFRDRPLLKRWIVVTSLGWLPVAMMEPFVPLYAHELKGADQFVLGGMATAGTLVSFVLGIPVGRLADRVGRKKVLYLITPLLYASRLVLVLAPSPEYLVLSGVLQGFYTISFIVQGSMTAELVPISSMGRWIGVIGLFNGLISIPAPVIGGLIWKHVNPAYVFLVPLAIDLLLRIPTLTTIPETLKTEEAPALRYLIHE